MNRFWEETLEKIFLHSKYFESKHVAFELNTDFKLSPYSYVCVFVLNKAFRWY